MRNQRIITFAIIILLVLNIVMVAGFWITRNDVSAHGPDHFPPPPKHGGGFLAIELELNDSQKDELKAMRDQHFESTKNIHDQLHKKRSLLHDLLKGEASNADQAKEMAANIGVLHAQIEQLTFEHFREIRAICDKDQKEKFDLIIKEVLKGMGPQGPPPPHKKH